MVWEEVKKFCSTLDEEQLKTKVILWNEEEVISDIEVMKLEADHYIGKDEDGCYTLSDAGIDIKDVNSLGLKKVYKKYCPILWVDFVKGDLQE